MLAFVDGRFVPEDSPALSVRDRSFMYGDGLFETIRIIDGQPFLWEEHVARMRRGAEFLRIRVPLSDAEFAEAVRHLISQNVVVDGTARAHLSRGVGLRGYSPKNAEKPTFVITAHPISAPLPTKLRVITSTVRVLSSDPSARFKTANRLASVRARMEADDAGMDEALILNERGEIVEASGANVFVVREGKLITPPLSAGALEGTTRGFVMREFGAVEETVRTLENCEGAFLTSAGHLAAAIVECDGAALKEHPIVARIRRACVERR